MVLLADNHSDYQGLCAFLVTGFFSGTEERTINIKYYSIIPILFSVMLLSACNDDDDDDGGSSSSKTELEGRWGFPATDFTLIFSGNEYDLNIPEIPDIPGIDFCSDFESIIIKDPCSAKDITSSGTFKIGDSFTNSRGETVTKITFSQELLNGESDSRTELATYRKDENLVSDLLYFGDRNGNLVDQALFKK